MLRIVTSPSASAAKNYYTSGLSRGDYYSEQEESRGVWGGIGAERLGLTTEVTQEQFGRLCENRHPDTGEQLTPRMKANRRVGYDINFHAPKSLSLLVAIGQDRQLVDAFQSAVRTTMELIERDVQTRVRVGREMTDRTTSNLVWAQFTHHTARPVDGYPDPHLHAHCFVFNATRDDIEQRWKAVQMGAVKRDAYFYEAAFHNELCRNLRQLGYTLCRKGKFWELDGFSEDLLGRFSRRGKEVEAFAKELGIEHDARLKDGLAAKTRQKKNTDLSRHALRELWHSALTNGEIAWLQTYRPQGSVLLREGQTVADECVRFATEHQFERSSTASERRILDGALRHSLGRTTLREVTRTLQAAPLLQATQRDGSRVYSRSDVLDEERYLVGFAKRGRDQCESFNQKAAREVPEADLTVSQKRSAIHVLRSRDRVTLVRGGAGTGKTHVMSYIVDRIERKGCSVVVLAPTAEASRDVLRREGFRDAETVSRFLIDAGLQTRARGQVLWVDEAGMLSAKMMADIFRAADELGARVILSGDQRQHKSVERGNAFQQLVQKAGLQTTELTDVVRQRGKYREVASHLAAGRTEAAWNGLEEMYAIREGTKSTIYEAAAREYRKATERGKSCLVVSPTHAERALVTGYIRKSLKEARTIRGASRHVTRLVATNWTEAERKDLSRYKESGQIIQFHRNCGHWKAGQRVRVVGASEHGISVTGHVVMGNAVSLRHAKHFTVYEEQQLELAKGDKVRITVNAKTRDGKHKLTNGSIYEVRSVGKDGSIRLTNGFTLAPEFGHLDHGYVVTSHKSQGKTVDRVVIVQSELSHAATSAEQFYVSVTRGRERVRVFTDDKAALKELVLSESPRLTAMELFGQRGDLEERATVQRAPTHEAHTPRPRVVERESQKRGHSL